VGVFEVQFTMFYSFKQFLLRSIGFVQIELSVVLPIIDGTEAIRIFGESTYI